jgi:hypothetical protein
MLLAIVPVLERGKDTPVGQSQIGVRVHAARHIGKRSCDCGMQGIAEIEDEGCTGVCELDEAAHRRAGATICVY